MRPTALVYDEIGLAYQYIRQNPIFILSFLSESLGHGSYLPRSVRLYTP